MASNFWTSTHYKELKDPEEVNVVHPLDAQRGISVEDFRLIKLHMSNYISKLAQHIKIRQRWSLSLLVLKRYGMCYDPLNNADWFLALLWFRVVATAVTYMRRVYTRKSLTEYEPRLVAPTCLYLACKAEESVVHAKLLVFYMKKLCKFFFVFCFQNFLEFFLSEFLMRLDAFTLCRCGWKVSIWD
jgi:cyclin C